MKYVNKTATALEKTDLPEKDRIKFLLGLNLEFEQVCDCILGRETFPDLDQAFALVRGAESRKELLHGKEDNGNKNPIEGSLLAVSKPNSKFGDSKMPAEKDKRWCIFAIGLDKRETCRKIHGIPANFKGSRRTGQGKQVATESLSPAFQKKPEAPSFRTEQ